MNYGGLMPSVAGRKHQFQREVRPNLSIPCPRPFEQIGVLVDGRVSLCSADPMGKHCIGDLKTQTMKEVFYGELRLQALKAHIDLKAGSITPCKDCDYTVYCGTPFGEYFGEVRSQ